MNGGQTVESFPVHRKPLLLYLDSSSSTIGALIAQKDGGGIEQPMYYVSRALKDDKKSYPQAERMCLAIIYVS